jgi:hypothetical protein
MSDHIGDSNKMVKTWMTRDEILEELDTISDRLESIKTECEWTLKGYAGGAADLAATAVNHVIDLVRVSAPTTESKGDE